MSQRLLFLSRGRSLAPVDVMRLEKAVPCSPSTCSGVKRFAFSTAFRRRSCSYRPQDLVKSFPDKILHSNEYLITKFGFHTAENEPCKVRTLSSCGEQPERVDPARTAPFAVEVYRPEPYVCAVKKSGSVPNFH